MARTPGRPSERPDDEPLLAVDELTIFDIGVQLIDLGERLVATGRLTNNPGLRDDVHHLRMTMNEDHERAVDESIDEAFRRTLGGLRDFRQVYDYWERVIAEYALTRRGLTQRKTAALLGVSTATINRWAQNPVTIPTGEEHSR